MISSKQCTAARALIGWKQKDLSDAITSRGGKLSVTAITAFERGGTIRASNAELLKLTLEAQGIQFLDPEDTAQGAGVALKAAEK